MSQVLPEIEEQIQQLLEGGLDPEGHRTLQARLLESDEARALYHEMVQLHGLLHGRHVKPLAAEAPDHDVMPVVRAGARTLIFPLASALAAAWMLAMGLWAWVKPLEPRPILIAMAGPVEVERIGRREQARPGMPLQSADRILTGGAGWAVVRFRGEATRIELSADTRCAIDWPGRAKRVNLETGYLTCQIAPQPAGKPMVLKTPDARAVVLGTRFSLSAGSQLTRLAVTQGSVRLEDARSSESLKTEAGWIAEVGSQTLLGKRKIADLVLADGPVAYWRLNGPEGTLEVPNLAAGDRQGTDRMDGRVHRVAFNRPGPPVDLFPDFEIASTSAEFSGHNEYIAIRDPGERSPFDFDVGDAITLEAWVNLRSIRHDTQVYIVGKGRTNNPGFPFENHNWGLRLRGEGDEARLSFIFRNRRNRPRNDPGHRDDWHRWVSHEGFLPGSGWHHVAVSYVFGDGDSLKAWIDGREVTGFWDYGGKSNDPPVVDDDEVWIGSSLGGSRHSTFDGQIEEVAIYRKKLSAEQIGNHYRRAR